MELDLFVTVTVSIISALGGGVMTYSTVRVSIESRLKELEKEVQLLGPIKCILLEKGSEHVIDVFKGGNHESH
ncbi:hypothetical protein [Methanoculleus sp. 7T]|uniref:hypothetical protein n=1 Tax=Methanoculleus sp. 7T TaxID=2937282 RepID=UPI0020BDDABB|nr:hypothetical protein [Methanoculleus sp. 7T]MCK8519273.1 hypothetical protein [Methanoculleus sp. 7T]